MMGTIGCSPRTNANPSVLIASQKYRVLDSSRSRRAVEADSRSKTFSDAAAITGARVLEKR